MLPMSSRSERRKKLYTTPAPVLGKTNSSDFVKNRAVSPQSERSGQMRTISPRMVKLIIIALIILVVLFMTTPQPPAPPGGVTKGVSDLQSKPLELNSVKTTIPPVQSTSSSNVLGETIKNKLELKDK